MFIRRGLKGFTLVEVTLVLSISALLMAGIIATINATLPAQYYSSIVNDSLDFMKKTYSAVLNVQSSSDRSKGQSEYAHYGKLLVFGSDVNDPTAVYIYDIVGRVYRVGDDLNSDLIQAIFSTVATGSDRGLSADIRSSDTNGVGYFYNYDYHLISMDGVLELKDGTRKYSILLIRSPKTGAIHTYYTTDNITPDMNTNTNLVTKNWKKTTKDSTTNDIDLCIFSSYSDYRRNLRLVSDASSSSSVLLVDENGGDNVCY